MFKTILKKAHIEWSKLTKFLMYIVLILSFSNLFARSDFLNLILGLTIWIIFIKDKLYDVLEYLQYFSTLIIITNFFDLFWLYFHTTGFWNSSYNSIPRKLTLLSSYLNFFAKFILTFTLRLQIKKARALNEREKQKQKDLKNSISLK